MKEWSAIDALGREYAAIREHGYGTASTDRTPRQQEIVAEIVERTIPFLAMLAYKALRTGVRVEVRSASYTLKAPEGMELEDLVQEGALRVHERFGAYDPSRGAVSTFLRLYAIAGMEDAIRAFPLVRRPTGRDARTGERLASPRYVRLDEPAALESEERRIDRLEDPLWRASYDACEDRLSVAPALGILPIMHREVLERRYGLAGYEAGDLLTVARAMGLTRQRVERLEYQAILRLRYHLIVKTARSVTR